MDIISLPIAELLPDPSNARLHDDNNLAAIKGSLAKFGQQKPIVISPEKVIIAGNGTYVAAKALGWDKIDVVISALGKTEQIAFALADNRTSELSSWNDDILSKTLHALREEDFDLTSLGFDISELDKVYQTSTTPIKDGSKELKADDFSVFDHTCPRCGFEFDK